MRNADKCPKNPLFRSGEKKEKVIRNPHTDPDHHQKLITSRGSPLASCPCLPSLVDVRSRVRQLSCLQNDTMTYGRSDDFRIVGGGNNTTQYS